MFHITITTMAKGPGTKKFSQDGYVQVKTGSARLRRKDDDVAVSGKVKVKDGDELYWTTDCDWVFTPS